MYGHLTFVREPEFLHLFDVSANLNRHNIVGTETRPSQNILQWHIDCFALKLLKKCASQEGSSDAPLFPWKQNLSWESEFSTFWRQRTSQRWNSGRGGYIQKSYFNSLPKVQPHLDSSLIKLPKPKCCCPVTNLTSHKFILLSKSLKSACFGHILGVISMRLPWAQIIPSIICLCQFHYEFSHKNSRKVEGKFFLLPSWL